MNNRIGFFVLILVLFNSCFTFKRAIKKNKVLVDTANTQAVRDSMKKNDFDFIYFSAKAKFTLVDDKGSRTANANIRIKHDSAIWISVSALGIEGLRILATHDSVKIIDRLNKNIQVTIINTSVTSLRWKWITTCLKILFPGFRFFSTRKNSKRKKKIQPTH